LSLNIRRFIQSNRAWHANCIWVGVKEGKTIGAHKE